MDGAGNLFIADTDNNRIRKVEGVAATPRPGGTTITGNVSDAFTPLGANLVRVWGFNAATHKFQLYDPAAALLSGLDGPHPRSGVLDQRAASPGRYPRQQHL